MSWKVDINPVGSPDEWVSNNLRFEHEHDAEYYGRDLLSRWSGAKAYRVVESDDPYSHVVRLVNE